MVFQECFKTVSRKFQESSKGVQVRLKGISSFKRIQEYLKEVQQASEESFKGVLRKFPRFFKEVSILF